ncbi:MAG: hypothetical protein U9N83_05845 [Thermodesulfobacteriota bacterium]|nr:hypothetical protein [Thermodesulfobacteriota bacterium]
MPAKRPKVIQNKISRSNIKIKRLVEYLETTKEQKFTGYIKINFSQGGISRIEKFEEILKN